MVARVERGWWAEQGGQVEWVKGVKSCKLPDINKSWRCTAWTIVNNIVLHI